MVLGPGLIMFSFVFGFSLFALETCIDVKTSLEAYSLLK